MWCQCIEILNSTTWPRTSTATADGTRRTGSSVRNRAGQGETAKELSAPTTKESVLKSLALETASFPRQNGNLTNATEVMNICRHRIIRR